MNEQTLSKCQICGKLCRWTDAGTKAEGWQHITEQGHPPFVALEYTKKDAIKAYNEWKREYGK